MKLLHDDHGSSDPKKWKYDAMAWYSPKCGTWNFAWREVLKERLRHQLPVDGAEAVAEPASEETESERNSQGRERDLDVQQVWTTTG